MVVFVVGRLVVVLLLLLLVVWIVRGFREARRRQVFLDTRDFRGRPMLPPQQRVGDDQLRARAAELRRAVDRGYITPDEALGSLVRFGGAGLSPERARHLLEGS